MGVLRAAEGFNPAKGARFTTYTSYWIKQCIRRAILNSAKSIRIPIYLIKAMARWRTAEKELKEKTGRDPSSREIAAFMGITEKQRKNILRAFQVCNVTNLETADREDSWKLDDALTNHRPMGEEENTQVEMRELVMAGFKLLAPRSARIVALRFGLFEEGPKTLNEIAEMLGLTKERVRQIEASALATIGKQIRHQGFNEADWAETLSQL